MAKYGAVSLEWSLTRMTLGFCVSCYFLFHRRSNKTSATQQREWEHRRTIRYGGSWVSLWYSFCSVSSLPVTVVAVVNSDVMYAVAAAASVVDRVARVAELSDAAPRARVRSAV
jgi:hypothetical protein